MHPSNACMHAPSIAAKHCYRAMPRTNERYGRTYRSPRDPSVALGDAHVRAQPGVVVAVTA